MELNIKNNSEETEAMYANPVIWVAVARDKVF